MIKILARIIFFVLLIPFILIAFIANVMFHFMDKLYLTAYPLEHYENDNFSNFKSRRK